MSIITLSTDWGTYPRIVRMETTDDLAVITASGYLATAAVIAAIEEIQNGEFTWFPNDIVAAKWGDGFGFLSYDATDNAFASLAAGGGISDTLPSGEILVGNASNIATAVAMTGDVAITNAGVTTVQAGAITTSKIAANAVGSAQLATDVQQYISVAMTAAQFIAMFATPFQIVAAPAAGNVIVVDKMLLTMDYGTTAYAAGGNIALQYGNTDHLGGSLASAVIANTAVEGTASVLNAAGGAIAAVPTVDAAALGLYISAATAFTTGDSTFTVNVWYKIVPST